MGYSGAEGKRIHEKNLKAKISWHCPFKCKLKKNPEPPHIQSHNNDGTRQEQSLAPVVPCTGWRGGAGACPGGWRESSEDSPRTSRPLLAQTDCAGGSSGRISFLLCCLSFSYIYDPSPIIVTCLTSNASLSEMSHILLLSWRNVSHHSPITAKCLTSFYFHSEMSQILLFS